jgi:hypothetical protein
MAQPNLYLVPKPAPHTCYQEASIRLNYVETNVKVSALTKQIADHVLGTGLEVIKVSNNLLIKGASHEDAKQTLIDACTYLNFLISKL